MKKYTVEMSETAKLDLENIISYLKYDLAGDIIADKYKLLFKQELRRLEVIAGSMPVLDEKLTGHNNIRKVNVRNYIIFYVIDEEKYKALVVRIGHAFMDWKRYLKDE
ncbi:MAG: type II toxin-antitoxin system RelE/ParE family toxin [Clostridia bacterium]|nr:type II toxin-antitoxin system RelE/ParE family toxin [Clostridia bacterium]